MSSIWRLHVIHFYWLFTSSWTCWLTSLSATSVLIGNPGLSNQLHRRPIYTQERISSFVSQVHRKHNGLALVWRWAALAMIFLNENYEILVGSKDVYRGAYWKLCWRARVTCMITTNCWRVNLNVSLLVLKRIMILLVHIKADVCFLVHYW